METRKREALCFIGITALVDYPAMNEAASITRDGGPGAGKVILACVAERSAAKEFLEILDAVTPDDPLYGMVLDPSILEMLAKRKLHLSDKRGGS